MSSDVAGTVTNVSFYNGDTLIGSDTTAPYSVVWTNVPAGEYRLTARATDSTGQVSTSTVAVITVDGNTVPVTSGLACWFDASFGVTTDAQQVTRSGMTGPATGITRCFDTVWDKPVVMQQPAVRETGDPLP